MRDIVLGFYLRAGAHLALIAAAYVAVYRVLSPRVLGHLGGWINTAIFVGPALNPCVVERVDRALVRLVLPADLTLAVGGYIGLSFLLQWRLRYGGCEVVALPIALGAPAHVTYCIPLVAADAVEKRIVDRHEVSALGA